MSTGVVITTNPIVLHTFSTVRSPLVCGQTPRAPCTACSCSGVYVDYAGPDVAGGIAVACRKCGGTGWRSASAEASA